MPVAGLNLKWAVKHVSSSNCGSLRLHIALLLSLMDSEMSKDEGHDAPPTMTSTTFQVSVLRCKSSGKVLFLEAGKDFVDTILSFMLLPVGTIMHLLSNGTRDSKSRD